jgi:hypothetical protein
MDPDPDPHQNVMDPQQCFIVCLPAAMRAAAKAVPAALLAATKYSGVLRLPMFSISLYFALDCLIQFSVDPY